VYKIDSDMEKAIVEAYTKTIQELTRKCMESIEAESRAFATALSAVKGIGVDPSLESRLRTLEARASVEHRFHTTLNGLSEDIGDLNERLLNLEKNNVQYNTNADSISVNDCNPWSTDADNNQFIFDNLVNEVVVDDRSTTVDLSPFVPNTVIVNKKEQKQEQEQVKMVEEAKVVEEVKVVEEAKVVEQKQEQEEEQEEQEEQEQEEEQEEDEEEEESALKVEPFEYNNTTYYKDDENNVYQEDEDGNVDDTPIGRYLEAKKKVKFYPTSA
jgi:hypothetical protein